MCNKFILKCFACMTPTLMFPLSSPPVRCYDTLLTSGLCVNLSVSQLCSLGFFFFFCWTLIAKTESIKRPGGLLINTGKTKQHSTLEKKQEGPFIWN